MMDDGSKSGTRLEGEGPTVGEGPPVSRALSNRASHMPGLDPEEQPTFRGTVSFVAAARVTS